MGFITIIGTLSGLVVGFLMNWGYEAYKGRKRLENAKKILVEELIENQEVIIHSMPVGCDDGKFDAGRNLLTVSVYDSFLNRICELKRQELQRVYKAYLMVRELRSGRVHGYMRSFSIEKRDEFAQNTVKAIEEAVKMFDEGEERLGEADKKES